MRLTSRQLLLAVLWACLGASTALAQEAARLVPASAAIYIEINDLAGLRKAWSNDPLSTFLRNNLPVPPTEGFDDVQKVMGLTSDQIIDRFFGVTAALVIFKPGEEEPGMLITRVSDADAALAIEKLQLKQVDTFGADGAYRGFTSPDGKANIAIGGGWVIVSQPKHTAAARAVLEGSKKTLADQPTFKAWTARLPAGQRAATIFVNPREDHVHVLGVYRKGRDLTLQYRGKSPELDALASHVGNGQALDLGPLPASTIAAINLNLKPVAGPGTRQLNRLFPGKTFDKDIAPYLAAPALFFLGEVPGDKINPNPGLSLPVVGAAIKITDPKVADDLSQAINGLIIVANFAAAKWELPLVEVKELAHSGASYRSANIGAALAKRADRDELKPVTLTYGRVGDWYIVCTHDDFFTQCIDADLDSARKLTASDAFTRMPVKDREAPVATAVLRPKALAAHIETWLSHWKEVRPDLVASSAKPEPASPEAHLIRGAGILSGLLDHYQSMSLQAYRDGDAIAAEAAIIRK